MKLLHLLLPAILTPFVLGCESDEPTAKDALTIESAIESIMPAAERSLDELKKLEEIEYRIISINSDTAPEEVITRLNEAGKEHWDCFHVQPKEENEVLDFFCKRRTHSALRYIPRTMLPIR